ncbi:MAG TPA: malonyl-CoA synthase [Oceanospirillaceae bacterium]|nr:malonyl-CoA synthase [Oceanospirillaceae bacterium]
MYDNNPLAYALRQASINHGAAIFIHAHGERAAITYNEFFANCEKMAAALVVAGLQPGERVAAQIEKTVTGLELYVGTVLAGGVFLPLNTAYTLTELDYFFTDAAPSVVICDPDRKSAIAAMLIDQDVSVWSLAANESGDARQLRDQQEAGFSAVARTDDDLGAILYTSGTTGQPKGAMLTHRGLVSNALTLQDAWQYSANDCLIHALPIFHIHGLFVAINITLVAGASLNYMAKYQAQAVTDAMATSTVLMGVPTFYTRLLANDGFTANSVSNMRLFISGSAPLLAETHQLFEARCGLRILERYGMTETGMMSSNPYEGERLAGTVGMPLPGISMRVANAETGEVLAQGESGVVEVKGPNVFKGYWNKPTKTAAEFRDDGYFITGDIGSFDEQGYLSIIGRAKDLIITGGLNVYPKEIESLLDKLEGVAESAVIGVPHPDFGEAVVGILVSHDGNHPTDMVIMAQIKDRLARFKQPKALFWVNELPRNAMAKVQKNLLRDQYADLFS